ncbi:MAG: hypothetical protein AABW80_01055 [Nanoarchaeota archaeon]
MNKRINFDFRNIPDIRKYQSCPRSVKYHGLAVPNPSVAVKMYSMFEKGRPFLSDDEERTLKGSVEEILLGEGRFSIEPKLGIGFSIVSEDVLNISMWGGEYPSLINPNIFSWDERKVFLINLKRQRIEDVGAYCAWEVAILAHESEAWRRFLRSAKEEKDIKIYLADIFSGEILR